MGLVAGVLELCRRFRPADYAAIYGEFNVLGVCAPFLCENHVVGTDLVGQAELLEICVSLLGKDLSAFVRSQMPVLKLFGTVKDRFVTV